MGSLRFLSNAQGEGTINPDIRALGDDGLDDAPPQVLRDVSRLLDEQLGTDLQWRFRRVFDSRLASAMRLGKRIVSAALLLGVSNLVLGASVNTQKRPYVIT